VEDTGGRIKGNRIDIFTGNGKNGLIEALKIRGWLKLTILKWGAQESSL
jgi:membrane-bound lytic murein transglycosylase